MKAYLLGIDLGSGSVKLTLLHRSGRVAATCGQEYPTFYPQVGFAEQEPEDWCAALEAALKKLFAVSGVAPDEIAAIAPDAATHTAVLLDAAMRPVRRAILWTDKRSAQEVEALKKDYLSLIWEKVLNTPTTVWTLPQLMWLRVHEPEALRGVRHLLFAKDYLRYRLTGRVATDTIEAIGSMFYDVVNQRWDEALCRLAEIDSAWLPELLSPTDHAGEVTAEAAALFGLCPGTPVLCGTTDTALEQLAAGSVAPGHAVVKLATAGRICIISEKACPSPFIFNYRHVVPNLWYPGTATASCANSYRWFRDALGCQSYDALNALAAPIPPGSEGLFFHPYLQGELTPYNDPSLQGSFVGISTRHQKGHFTRAVLEGVAFSLKNCLSAFQDHGLAMSRARIIGGGAKSPLWRQIVADVLGLTLEKAENDDSSFGAAMLAGVGVGIYADFPTAAAACVKVQSVTVPNDIDHQAYQGYFKTYQRIHDALAPIYH